VLRRIFGNKRDEAVLTEYWVECAGHVACMEEISNSLRTEFYLKTQSKYSDVR
jgi:hypothetical protein